jgi:hypothetical protein
VRYRTVWTVRVEHNQTCGKAHLDNQHESPPVQAGAEKQIRWRRHEQKFHSRQPEAIQREAQRTVERADQRSIGCGRRQALPDCRPGTGAVRNGSARIGLSAQGFQKPQSQLAPVESASTVMAHHAASYILRMHSPEPIGSQALFAAGYEHTEKQR